jgi:hypothetical protein
MPASKDAGDNVFKAAAAGLKRWLGVAKEAVMAPWQRFRAQPSPVAISSTVPVWQAEVDRILAALTPALREGWAAAHLPGDYDPNDPYIQANLALTRNLLVRIPGEVHAMVVKEILEGTNAGETLEQIAQRVDNVLTYTGSENWPNRARVIAMTETTRHRNSSALAHGLLMTKQNPNTQLLKEWDTRMDGKERMEHRLINGDVQPLSQPFIVGRVNSTDVGVEMMFPGDPSAPPHLVCNCRCDLNIRRA